MAHDALRPHANGDLSSLFFSDDMTEKENRKRQVEHNSKITSEFRYDEWKYQWKNPQKSFTYQIAHDHLVITKNENKNLELLAHLKSSTILLKSLYSDQIQSQVAIDSIKLALDEVKPKQDYELKKAIRPIVDRHERIEKDQEEMAGQLTEVQKSVELLVSLLLGDDAKRRRRYFLINAHLIYLYLKMMI